MAFVGAASGVAVGGSEFVRSRPFGEGRCERVAPMRVEVATTARRVGTETCAVHAKLNNPSPTRVLRRLGRLAGLVAASSRPRRSSSLLRERRLARTSKSVGRERSPTWTGARRRSPGSHSGEPDVSTAEAAASGVLDTGSPAVLARPAAFPPTERRKSFQELLEDADGKGEVDQDDVVDVDDVVADPVRTEDALETDNDVRDVTGGSATADGLKAFLGVSEKPAKKKRGPKTASRGGSSDQIFLRPSAWYQEVGNFRLLDQREEVVLGRDVQRLVLLEKKKDAVKKSLNREPTELEWAEALEMPPGELTATLRRYRRSKAEMVQCNLRLVISVAKRYMYHGMPLADLVQEGSLGLVKAVEKFDPDRGFKFSTYATWWIRQSVVRSISDHARVIRLPVHVHETLAAMKKARAKFVRQMNRQPSPAELAGKLNMKVSKVDFLLDVEKRTLSLDQPVEKSTASGRGGYATVGSFIEDRGETPESTLAQTCLKSDMLDFLRRHLSEKEVRVVELRYGLEDGNRKTLMAIGNEFQLSRERIRQIEMSALSKLRSRKEELRDYLS